MLSTKVTSKKWISEETPDEEELFAHCREMEMVCFAVTKVILDSDNKWKGALGKNNSHSLSNRNYIMELVNIQVLDQIIEYLTKLVKSFYKLNPKLARLKKDNGLLLSKHDHIFDKLCSIRFVMLQSIHGLINTILNTCLHREDSRKMIESCLSLVGIYNDMIGLSYKKFAAKFNIGSNSYPNIISETKNLSLTKIVQVLSKSRAEINCQRLINCLVKVYQPDHNSDNDSSSSSAESLEIYHTLTKHITPPTSTMSRNMVDKRRDAFIVNKKLKMKQAQSLIELKNEHNKRLNELVTTQNSDAEVPYMSLLTNEYTLEHIFNTEDNINSILQSEEMYIEILLDTVANMSPNLLGQNGVKKLKNGRIQASKKAAHKVTEYYQNILWGDVGSCLEHIVLWWSHYPLAMRSPNTSQNLREWLFATFNVNNTPELILSALRILADALGCHVTSTSWDKYFGATLTTNLKLTTLKINPEISLYITESTESGASFAIMLQSLATLNNQCEVTWDYILGAPLEDLPIVEQIPILHRLDHSIHTYRLWCLAETRRLANLWEMRDFFRIAHNDMQACMEQLINLRFADHTVTIESGKQNWSTRKRMRKDEGKTGIRSKSQHTKAKGRYGRNNPSFIGSVCYHKLGPPDYDIPEQCGVAPRHQATTNCTLHLCTRVSNSLYLRDKMLLPVIMATQDITTLNMILRIMCESWLHHIYVAKVKFTKDAAMQLLHDFNEVRNWLSDCKQLATASKKQMLQNEVLRRCEGVGRLLLHAPGDLISMQDSTMQSAQQVRKEASENDTPEQLMPAEMYVPNQKQWLTLRAKKMKGPIAFTLCCFVLY
uniref:SFRICE_001171 n=1 Tax=Spodoptera frugiperda TaxID=7108 RepID=A0A2H1VJ63_SPOFR